MLLSITITATQRPPSPCSPAPDLPHDLCQPKALGIVAGLSILVIIGILLAPAVVIAWLILVVLGAIKASEGKIYRFPLTIRFIK